MKCICFVILIVPAIIPEAVSAWPPADIFSKLISDFQDFHNQNRICLINSAQAHRDEDAKTPDYRSWITRTVSQLAKRSYLSVARAGSAEGFKLTVHARDNGTSPSIQKVCAGLVVAQLTDHNVAAEFSKIFTESLEQDQWLLMINQDMPELLTSLYLPLNNKVTLAMFSEDTTSASLWESYQILRGGTPKLVRVGSWNLGRQSIFEDGSGFETIPRVNVLPMKYLSRRSMRFGQIIAPEGDVAQRRWDLTGLHLRCTVLPDTTTLVIRNRDGTLSLGGVFGNLFNLIQEITNFTSTCHIPVDRKYGSFENGKWTGMVADLVQDRADIAVALLDVTEERVQDIDYLVSIGFSRYMVVMKRPSFSDFQWKTYIQEFHGHVWLLLLLSIVAMMLVFYVITALLPIEEKISLSESFTLVSGCIVGQGSWLNFRTVGARIAFLTAMISGVLLMAHYTSYLVSALAAGPSLPHYITLNKVYQLGIPTGWTDGTAMSEYIRLSSDDTHRKLWKSIEQNKRRSLVKDPTEGLRRVLQETYLFIETESVLLRCKHDCQYHSIPLLGFNQLSSFTVRKDSPLVPIFNKIIVDIQASGLLSRWWKDLMTKTTPACQSLEGSSIGLPTVFSIFAVMCIGLVLSFLIMLVERFNNRKNNVTETTKIAFS